MIIDSKLRFPLFSTKPDKNSAWPSNLQKKLGVPYHFWNKISWNPRCRAQNISAKICVTKISVTLIFRKKKINKILEQNSIHHADNT